MPTLYDITRKNVKRGHYSMMLRLVNQLFSDYKVALKFYEINNNSSLALKIRKRMDRCIPIVGLRKLIEDNIERGKIGILLSTVETLFPNMEESFRYYGIKKNSELGKKIIVKYVIKELTKKKQDRGFNVYR